MVSSFFRDCIILSMFLWHVYSPHHKGHEGLS